ncbi:MAG: sigma-70 family RNA polymerase sigma factor [bacterium]|nr:sigma-70 family RNA polymerase sigma factor [bacterium]
MVVHLPTLTRFVAYRVSDQDDAKDVLAETVCQFIEYCQRTDRVIAHPRGLLFRIARMRLVAYYETKSNRAGDITIEDAPELPAAGSLERRVEAREQLEQVHAALAEMREEDRELITLTAMLGLTIAEIAEMLETSPGAVRVRLHAARKKLKKRLRENEARTPHEEHVDHT